MDRALGWRHALLDSREKTRPGLLRSLGFGLLIGAAFGAVEVSFRLLGNEDVSVARRSFALIRYAAVWTGLLGAIVFPLANSVARVATANEWRSAREGHAAVLMGALVAILAPLAVLLVLSERLARNSATIRVCVLVIVVVCAVLSGWVVARRLSARPAGRISALVLAAWRPRAFTLAALAALLVSTWLTTSAQRRVVLAAPAMPTVERGPDFEQAIESAAGAAGPDILMILVDTLRADALACYGGDVPTPNMDALAERGALFEDAYAPASWTLPSVASLFTSTYPWQHGCWDFGRRIAADQETLAERLARAGYRCRAVVGNPFVEQRAGFARGFEVFDVYTQEIESELFVVRLFDITLELTGLLVDRRRVLLPWFESAVFPFLGSRLNFYVQDGDVNDRMRDHAWPQNDRPAFLYVHYIGPHTPYLEHPLRFLKSQPHLREENLEVLRARYEQEVAHTDAMIGELLAALAEDRALDEMFVVLTSDHGEEFLEHGRFEHGHGVYEEVVRVPLILAGPGIPRGVRVEGVAQLFDVAPTLLDLIGVEAPSTFEGRSLAPLFAENPEFEAGSAFCEAQARSLTKDGSSFGIVSRGWKVIRTRSRDGSLIAEEIYDLTNDPGEGRPLAPGSEDVPTEIEQLRNALDEYESRPRHAPRSTLDAEYPEELQLIAPMNALGYTDNDTQ